jgi:hypothetical protein
MHQTALQENIPFYLGFALVVIIMLAFIFLYKNNKNNQ